MATINALQTRIKKLHTLRKSAMKTYNIKNDSLVLPDINADLIRTRKELIAALYVKK